jgi:hypothetical protein
MCPAIVQVNVQLTIAPAPDTLQATGAILTQGGTNTSPGTLTLLTQPSSLTNYLTAAKAVTSISQTTGTATVTCTTAHGIAVGSTLLITIAGASPAAYNGTFLCTVTTGTAFTYSVPSGTTTPATGTITYLLQSSTELYQAVTTFFAQNFNTSVYVLELGPGSVNAGVAFLTNWITETPNGIAYGNGFWGIYSYLVPREWDANSNFLALLASFEGTTAKTYFWVTTTLATYSVYTAQMKCVLAMIENPVMATYPANILTAISWTSNQVTATTTSAHGVPVGAWFQISGVSPSGYNGYFQAVTGTTGETLVYNLATNPGAETALGTLVQNQYASNGIGANELTMAAPFQVALSFNPATGFVPPFSYSFLAGVTQFQPLGNGALLTTLQNANVNYVATGAEGGIGTTILWLGRTMDGNPFNFWYATDWLNININEDISNAVINGSNNTLNPLYYNQPGINALQAVGAGTISQGITAGMILGTLVQTELPTATFAANLTAGLYAGTAVINAVPFATYVASNPSAYASQSYGGFAVSFTPQFGFTNITFNLDATTFA